MRPFTSLYNTLTFMFTLQTGLEPRFLLNLQVSKACERSQYATFLFQYKNKGLGTLVRDKYVLAHLLK